MKVFSHIHLLHRNLKEGGGDAAQGRGEEAPSCPESISSSLCLTLSGDTCKSPSDEMLRSFSGESMVMVDAIGLETDFILE